MPSEVCLHAFFKTIILVLLDYETKTKWPYKLNQALKLLFIGNLQVDDAFSANQTSFKRDFVVKLGVAKGKDNVIYLMK